MLGFVSLELRLLACLICGNRQAAGHRHAGERSCGHISEPPLPSMGLPLDEIVQSDSKKSGHEL